MTTNDSTPNTPSDVLVLGATGKSGRRVTRVLREAGVTVRAASRSGEVKFDWTDRTTWGPALDGADAVYLVAPEDPTPIGDFVNRAVEAGVRRFVALSGRGIEHAVGSGFGEGMLAAEEAVRGSGAQWTILRPTNFFQNFTEDLWHTPVLQGRLALPIGEVPEAFIDLEDLAEAAATILTAPDDAGHVGQVYELSGPEALTFREATATVAEAAGRTVEYVELTPEEYRTELREAGVPEEWVSALDALFALHRKGHTTTPATGIPHILNREATPLKKWATRAAAENAWQ
ncbi:NAD(P)H-binding protein [Streptomyces sp. NPDC050504]|uniref:NmrA family NAD(P)-binding protein n=1 Tax=Streptomyces sp. NPDC050504 TaxID=3365618 RepID=UPI0037BAB8AE